MNDQTTKTPRSIGQLARAAGLPTSTLRYYEREGLLSPVSRSRAGYRVYDEESLDRLKAIRLAQRAGLSLADVKELSDLQGERGFYEAMKQRLAERLGEVDERIGQLQELRQRIGEALHCCDTQANCPRECRTFDQSLSEGCADTAGKFLLPGAVSPLTLHSSASGRVRMRGRAGCSGDAAGHATSRSPFTGDAPCRPFLT